MRCQGKVFAFRPCYTIAQVTVLILISSWYNDQKKEVNIGLKLLTNHKFSCLPNTCAILTVNARFTNGFLSSSLFTSLVLCLRNFWALATYLIEWSIHQQTTAQHHSDDEFHHLVAMNFSDFFNPPALGHHQFSCEESTEVWACSRELRWHMRRWVQVAVRWEFCCFTVNEATNLLACLTSLKNYKLVLGYIGSILWPHCLKDIFCTNLQGICHTENDLCPPL